MGSGFDDLDSRLSLLCQVGESSLRSLVKGNEDSGYEVVVRVCSLYVERNNWSLR